MIYLAKQMMLFVKILFPLLLGNPVSEKPSPKPDSSRAINIDHCRDIVGVSKGGGETRDYVFDKQIYALGCDTLPQVQFWQSVMKLSKDSCLINIAHNRTIIAKMSNADWDSKPDSSKTAFRNMVRKQYGLGDTARILVTVGKSFFYDFDHAYGSLHHGIHEFMKNDVDPWYAQAIILIESPNKLQKSNVGAYGPFQLMKPVARMFGLKVNKKIDERADFDRAAYAASSLIKRVCIPKTKEMLDSLGIKYNEQDVWFRLLVMHSYHAGSGNVKAALAAINPSEGGIDLIRQLWHTEAKGFRTASQNYSQLALAAMIEMNKKVGINGLSVAN
jgi:Transglycosylase SLT domain